MNAVIKQKTLKNEKYLKWVKQLPSVISHRPADDPHHLTGHHTAGTGQKVTDYWAFPLTRDEHTELHNMGYKAWEEKYGSQWRFVSETLLLAIAEGVL